MVIIATVAVIASAASAQTARPVTDAFTDKRDGKTYRTVKIGTRIWMGENLNYKTANSACYDNDTSLCATFGRLYKWDDAMTACPAGWRLPANEVWDKLMVAVGGKETAGTKLKSKVGWKGNGNSSDMYGFSVMPGGGYVHNDEGNDFININNCGYWWSATEEDTEGAWCRHIDSDYMDSYLNYKTDLYSVRCVRD